MGFPRPVMMVMTPEQMAAERVALQLLRFVPELTTLKRFFDRYPPKTEQKRLMKEVVNDVLELTNMRPTVAERLIARIDISTQHWLMYSSNKRIETIYVGNEQINVKRFLYQHFIGPLEEGDQLYLWCDNSHCVRPSHCTVGEIKRQH